MKSTFNEVGQIILPLMKARGFNQRSLSKVIGMDESRVCQLIHSFPSIPEPTLCMKKVFIKIAEVLDISPNSLLGQIGFLPMGVDESNIEEIMKIELSSISLEPEFRFALSSVRDYFPREEQKNVAKIIRTMIDIFGRGDNEKE